METEASNQQLAPACHEGVNHVAGDPWPPVNPSDEIQRHLIEASRENLSHSHSTTPHQKL